MPFVFRFLLQSVYVSLFAMLSKAEQEFIDYWENHRQRENRFLRKMVVGSPWGLIFSLPILLAVLFDGWYKRMLPVTKGQMILIWIAVISIAFFYAYFRQQVRWEKNERAYQELKFKDQRKKQENQAG